MRIRIDYCSFAFTLSAVVLAMGVHRNATCASETGGLASQSQGVGTASLTADALPLGDGCVEIQVALDGQPYAEGCSAIQVEVEEVVPVDCPEWKQSQPVDWDGPAILASDAAEVKNSIYVCEMSACRTALRFVVLCESPTDGLMRSIRTFTRVLDVDAGWPVLLSTAEAGWTDPVTSSDSSRMPVVSSGPTDLTGLDMEMEIEALSKTQGGEAMAGDSDPLLVFIGNWKYLERRIQCEPGGGSTGARFPCSEVGNLRAIRGAQVEIWRWRGGVLTKLFTGWTSPTLLSGGYLFALYSDYQPDDLFWSVLTLKRSEPGGPEGDFYWGVAENGSFGWAPSFVVGGVDNGGYIMVDFGSTTVNFDLANIYATFAEAWTLWSDSSVYKDFLSWSPLFVNHYDVEYLSECPNGSGVSAHPIIQICSHGDYESWRMPFLHAHELGHDINQSAFFPQLLQPYYNYPLQSLGGGHTWSSIEWEEAAFIEGWANFVAASVMYDPGASAPLYMVGSAGQFPMSDPAGRYGPVCTSCLGQPNRCEANVARFFWDLYDPINDEYYGDYLSLETVELVDALAEFPDCTTNRCAGEANGSLIADDGPNVLDLEYWLTQLGYNGAYVDGIIHSNCLEDSATD